MGVLADLIEVYSVDVKFRSFEALVRRCSDRASRIMANRALTQRQDHRRVEHLVEEILGRDGFVTGVRIRDAHTSAERVLDVTGVFVAIDHDPRSELFCGQVALNPDGYVSVRAPNPPRRLHRRRPRRPHLPPSHHRRRHRLRRRALPRYPVQTSFIRRRP